MVVVVVVVGGGNGGTAYRAGLLVGWVTGQGDEVLEWVLRAQVWRVADGGVGEVGGGRLGEERPGGEVQRRGGVRTPADAWREKGVGEETVCFISDPLSHTDALSDIRSLHPAWFPVVLFLVKLKTKYIKKKLL